MPLIFALVVATVVGGAILLIVSSGRLVRSGIEDLARRRRLLQGTDPLQLTAQQALDTAHRSHRRAVEALGSTLDGWYDLRTTLGIGTTLEADFPQIRDRADADPGFAKLLDRANAASTENLEVPPESVAGLVDEIARLDSLTLELRLYLHRARSR